MKRRFIVLFLCSIFRTQTGALSASTAGRNEYNDDGGLMEEIRQTKVELKQVKGEIQELDQRLYGGDGFKPDNRYPSAEKAEAALSKLRVGKEQLQEQLNLLQKEKNLLIEK